MIVQCVIYPMGIQLGRGGGGGGGASAIPNLVKIEVIVFLSM